VVCEATAKPQDYGDPALCGGAFAFGYTHHFVGAALGRAESVQRWPATTAASAADDGHLRVQPRHLRRPRLWDQVVATSAAYRLAAAGYLLQPGTPFVYYGEEIGQAGIPACRATCRCAPDELDGRCGDGRLHQRHALPGRGAERLDP
jgi:alpha-amylase